MQPAARLGLGVCLTSLVASFLGCFGAEFLDGGPCTSDADCGPKLTCRFPQAMQENQLGTCGSPNNAVAICGNGVVETGEACDDGNDNEADGCTNTCIVRVCGDGKVGPGEECDDNNDIDTDKCTNDCTIYRCGDGIVASFEGSLEQCDDSNHMNNDRCTNGCQNNVCGDGFLCDADGCDGEEECEYKVDDVTCTPTCKFHVCGDGYVGPAEPCDTADLATQDGCNEDCTLATCNNGMLDPGEACDPSSNDPTPCTDLCTLPVCGDGLLHEGIEECDDGNNVYGDGCHKCVAGNVSSCGDLHALDPSLIDGIYPIELSAGPIDVWCNMSTGGGGWTLVLISSDDDEDTWTWNNRAKLTNGDTSPVGEFGSFGLDFKSPAYHEIALSDLLFVHAPSGVWARYDGVGNGSEDLGTYIGGLQQTYCGNASEVAHTLHPSSTLTLSGLLCDTNLYFNLGDHEDGEEACEDADDFSSPTFGPAWNTEANDSCDFDDPPTASLGPIGDCDSCDSEVLDTEERALGFGGPLGLNIGLAGTGVNNLRVYVR